MKILLIGNGSDEIISNNNYSKIYAANSSYVRLKNVNTPVVLVLSESLIWTKKKLGTLPPINSRRIEDRENSLKIRLEKQKTIKDIEVEELVILSIDNENKDHERLKNLKKLGINFSSLTILSHRDRLFLMFRVLGFFTVSKTILFSSVSKLLIFYFGVVKVILGGKMQLEFRPSTGIITIILALLEEHILSLDISGIGDNYGNGSFYNSTFVSNISLHSMDHLYLQIIRNKYPLYFSKDK